MSSDSWTFVTNHARVLACLARDPETRLRDVAATIGITERATQRIIADLVEAGYIDRERIGRRNRYTLNRERTLRHVTERGTEIGDFLDVLERDQAAVRATSNATAPSGQPG
jgi:DNA-binding MarR family transcriptional regulator